MIRYVVAFIAFLSALPAHATFVTVEWPEDVRLERIRPPAIAAPTSAPVTFRALHLHTLGTIDWRYEMTPADVGQSIVLNEANADMLGVDWNALELAWHQPSIYSYRIGGNSYDIATISDPPPGAGNRWIFDDLHEVKLEVLEYFFDRFDYVVRWHYTLTGDARAMPIPEPTTLLLVTLGICGAFFCRPRCCPAQSN